LAPQDGFWLVVSPGENPKYNAQEYAILYGDREANRITAYTYDGENNADSFRTGDLLGTFDNAFTDGGTHATYGDMTMFSLDVGAINGAFDTADWDGVSFGGDQGIWFHQTEGSQFAYNADGTISDYTITGQMFLDLAFQHTNSGATCGPNNTGAYYCATGTTPTNTGGGGSVPAPGGLALVLMGLAGFGLRRKK